MIPIVPNYSEVDPTRKKAVFLLFQYMGVDVKEESEVPDSAVFALRLVPLSHLLSGLIIKKLADGYSYRQVCQSLPVTMREVRTTVKRHRYLKKDTEI